MSNVKQFLLIGVAVVVSGAAAVVSADHAINGTIHDMSENTSQKASTEPTEQIKTPDTPAVQIITTPPSVQTIHKSPIKSDATANINNTVPTEDAPQNVQTQPTYTHPQPTTTVVTENTLTSE